MPSSTIKTSFAAGEISPSLFGRVDLSKYGTGAAELYNFFVDYRGGISTRPGTKYVAETYSDGAVRLVEFQFNADQTYILEFGNKYMRVVDNGGLVLHAKRLYTYDDGIFTLSTTNTYEVGDWVYLLRGDERGRMLRLTEIVSGTEFRATYQDGTPIGDELASGTVARVFKLSTPYLDEQINELQFSQSADVMTITHKDHPPRDLRRLGATEWELVKVSFKSKLDPPTNVRVQASDDDGLASYGYTVTSVTNTGEESLAANPAYIRAVINISTTEGSMIVRWNQEPAADYYNVYRTTITAHTTFKDTDGGNASTIDVPTGAQFGFIGTAFGTEFIDTNIVPDFVSTPPKNSNPFADSFVKKITITDGGAGYNPEGAKLVTASATTGSGFIGRPIVQAGKVVGVYIEHPGQNYSDDIELSVVGGSPTDDATFDVELGPATGNFPRCSNYFQQRKVYASTLNKPATIWGSRPGSFNNFDVSIPTNDGDSFEFSLVSQQVNYIKHLVQMPNGLIALTASGAWQLSGGGDNQPLTATNAVATPQAFIGSSDLPPILINYDLVYSQAKGGTIRSLAYNFVANAYTGQDLSILSNHLFDEGKYIVSWGYAEEPFKVIWSVRNDGAALAFTYLKDQEIFAWSRLGTRGEYVCVGRTQEGKEDVVYYVVRRTLNGRSAQYIERQAPREFVAAEDAWAVDCGVEHPQTYPEADINIVGTSGIVNVKANADVFGGGALNQIFRGGGGRGRIIEVVDERKIRVELDRPITDLVPPVGNNQYPRKQLAGSWSYAESVNEVDGLFHLEGELVSIFADGNSKPKQVVTGNKITLDEKASRIVVGLPYECRARTLPLEAQQTIQGKRKSVTAVTVKTKDTRGLRVGPDYDRMYPMKARKRTLEFGEALPLVTGDTRQLLPGDYNEYGQISFEVIDPVPATILAVTFEVNVGDT